MNRFFTKTFFNFFFGFVAIIGIAFGIMVAASHWGNEERSLDAVAHPQ